MIKVVLRLQDVFEAVRSPETSIFDIVWADLIFFGDISETYYYRVDSLDTFRGLGCVAGASESFGTLNLLEEIFTAMFLQSDGTFSARTTASSNH